MTTQTPYITEADQQTLFDDLFAPETLTTCFDTRFVKTDKVKRASEIAHCSADTFETVSRKCHNGSFRFSPYREKLVSKGRHKLARVISIPSARDKVVLRQLTEILQRLFPESAKQPKGSQYVKQIIEQLDQGNPDTIWIYRGDIQQFYDAIPRDQLLAVLAERIKLPRLLALIKHAINTPTVPTNAKRCEYAQHRRDKGVPQGLSISNLLANLYLHSLDQKVQAIKNVSYFRFVDDLFVLGNESAVKRVKQLLTSGLEQRGLTLHDTTSADKSQLCPATQDFSYLGYRFQWPTVSVRASSIERLRNSLIATIVKHRAKGENLNKAELIQELNIRITGAVSEKKQYGWLFYYRHINDLALLHGLDQFVKALCQKIPEFNAEDLAQIKRFSRAHFEIRHNLKGNYIFHYNETDMTLVELTTLDEATPQEDTEMSASNPQDKKNKKVKKSKKDKKIKQVKKDKKTKKANKKEKSDASMSPNHPLILPIVSKPKGLPEATLRTIINSLDQDVYTDDR